MAFSKACSFCGRGDWEAVVVSEEAGGVICEPCLQRATGIIARGGGDGILGLVRRGVPNLHDAR